MEKNIKQIQEEALQLLGEASDRNTVEALSIRYLGRKGEVTLYLRNIAKLPAEEKPAAGRTANQVKVALEKAFEEAFARIEEAEAESGEAIDVSLPGRPVTKAPLHPITQISEEICDIFAKLGFEIGEGPEVETDHYNFEALNIPKNHPARDMQDTFYLSDNIVLRTQTSPMQIRTMENQEPPVRIIAPGKVFRCDSDVTHTPMFHQIEGLLVDKDVSFGDLKGILTTFVHMFFGEDTNLRFRPSYFPFTEPSAEVDIRCVMCKGKGCRICSGTGWLEILGSGMVHPAVFETVGYDTSKYSGFAFGMGIERIAMLKYNVDDIRRYFDNDLRFLRQF